nr:hypothetical protein [Tanacetum cinerariifolium]
DTLKLPVETPDNQFVVPVNIIESFMHTVGYHGVVGRDERLEERCEMGSSENKTEKMQTPILTTSRSPRKNLSSDKNIAQELTDTVSLLTATTSKDPSEKMYFQQV